jgi:segregation and condensation protein B
MDEVSNPSDTFLASDEDLNVQDEELNLQEEFAAQQEIVTADALVEPPSHQDATAPIKAIIEAAIYITDQPLTPEQIAAAIEQPLSVVKSLLSELVLEYSAPARGLSIRELAGGYKMSTKAEHHEAIRRFVRNLQPPLKLSLAALETLAVIAYKQPITSPEIMEIRGVQGTGVLKTLLDRKLIASAGRKNVIGKPMLYKTTREFLVQFGLNSLAELPTLKEFEELGRLALSDTPEPTPPPELSSQPVAAEEPATEQGEPEHV